MNTTDPCHSKFAADIRDFTVTDLSNSIEFSLAVGGAAVLRETYNYDNKGVVVVRGLADVVSKALYGDLTTGVQKYARASVDFLIDGNTMYSHTIYSCRMKNPKDPEGTNNVLMAARRTVCHPGLPFYVSIIGRQPVYLVNKAGTPIINPITIGSDDGVVYTADCDPAVLFPRNYPQGASILIGTGVGEVRADIIAQECESMVPVRFLNRYDVMESLTAAYMSDKPAASDSVGMMYGKQVRFAVESSTDYSLYSGKLTYTDQYDTWQDLLTSRKAQVRLYGQWHDIIITKSNFTRQRLPFRRAQVELSFKTADPTLTL